jgi:hypothetical protein
LECNDSLHGYRGRSEVGFIPQFVLQHPFKSFIQITRAT